VVSRKQPDSDELGYRPILTREVAGLIGLLVLTEARRENRVRDGQLIPLDEQDRAGWDGALIAEGPNWSASAHDQPTRPLPVTRRDQRCPHRRPDRFGHGLVVGGRTVRPAHPARPVADRRAQPRGPGRGAGRPEGCPRAARPAPARGYHAWHAARADLLRRLGRSAEAKEAYDAAIAACVFMSEGVTSYV